MSSNQANNESPSTGGTALRNDAPPFTPASRRTAPSTTAPVTAASTAPTASATPAVSSTAGTAAASTGNAPVGNGRATQSGGRSDRTRGGRKGRDGAQSKASEGTAATDISAAAQSSGTPTSGNQTNTNGRRGNRGGRGGAGGANERGGNERRNRHADPAVGASPADPQQSRRNQGAATQAPRRQAAGRGRWNQSAATQPTTADRNSSTTRDSKSSRASGGPCPYNDDTPIPDVNPASVLGSSRFSELSKSMSEQLICGQYDCASCLDVIKHQPAVWSCKKCYRIFHLYCIKQWAKTEESGQGKSFRCPFCQNTSEKAEAYYCFCGKVRDPKYDPGAIPHSCGDLCCAKRGDTCPHPCPAPCHPGPCPPCSVQIQKPCACGKSTYSYGCDRPDPHTTCNNVCGKTLNCGKHTCARLCHTGPCSPCESTAMVSCACGKDSKETLCGTPAYQCENPCGKTQRCGVHKCSVVCHAGNCPPCDSDPAMVDSCPCGKLPLTSKRTKCTDPVPLCGNICDKALMCGHHSCDRECHFGPCGTCDKRVMAKCLCRQVQQKVDCTARDSFRCEKVCKTKMSCGKHECMATCCAGRGNTALPAHICVRVCGKQLPCGHPCPDICHPGSCAPCTNVITHELRCRCGTEVLIPPLPCSTLPPPCNNACQVVRPCGHTNHHKCHFGDCPPCGALVNKMCFGGHVEIKNVKCGSGGASCGRACKKPLPCGHECPRRCHTGPCIEAAAASSSSAVTGSTQCTLPCGKPLECGHFCQKKCHAHLPDSVCRCTSKVTMECSCGRRKKMVSCGEHAALLAKAIEVQRQKNKEAKAQRGEEDTNVDDDEVDVAKIDILECDNDCYHENRLQILAERGKFYTGPRRVVYSLALHDADYIEMTRLEKKIEAFLTSKDETLLLPAMKADKRAIVHELAQYYNLKTHSVDEEPNRSVTLTKTFETSTPTPLLSTAIYSSRTDENPKKLIEMTLCYPREVRLRVLAFAGTDISIRKVATLLSRQHGRFVAVDSVDTPELVGDKILDAVLDLVEPNVVFAIFLSHKDLENAFHNLRAMGKCGCFFQRINATDEDGGNGDDEANNYEALPAQAQQKAAPSKPSGGVSWSDFATTKAKKNNNTKSAGPSGGTFGFEALRRK